jgi:uncharacterized membrane protein YgaE (UPF0421/DUF939 family)
VAPTTLKRGFQIASRAAVGAALSLVIAQGCRLEYPLYAMLAAIIVTELSPAQTRLLAARRIVATLVGATCGALLARTLPTNPWTIGLGIAVAMLLCHFIRAADGARVAGYICGIAMLTHGADPWAYAFFRTVETLLGIAVASALSFLPKLLGEDEPARGGA